MVAPKLGLACSFVQAEVGPRNAGAVGDNGIGCIWNRSEIRSNASVRRHGAVARNQGAAVIPGRCRPSTAHDPLRLYKAASVQQPVSECSGRPARPIRGVHVGHSRDWGGPLATSQIRHVTGIDRVGLLNVRFLRWRRHASDPETVSSRGPPTTGPSRHRAARRLHPVHICSTRDQRGRSHMSILPRNRKWQRTVRARNS